LVRAFTIAAGAFTVGPIRTVASVSAFASVAVAEVLRHRVTCHHAEACGSHHQFECYIFHYNNRSV
jgi:hypothetical protein